MSEILDVQASSERDEALERAEKAIADGELVVIPTDTVYGVAANAFSAQAVALLLASKGRNRTMPPPVLIASHATMPGLARDITSDVTKLAQEFWPGALTIIVHAQPSLTWDLGETKGTVALRVPDDEVAQELLRKTGPLAVSSANRTGRPAARTAAEAQEQLADSVTFYLDGGERNESGAPSTIVDATVTPMRVVREGAISLERLRDVVPGIEDLDGNGPESDQNAEAPAES